MAVVRRRDASPDIAYGIIAGGTGPSGATKPSPSSASIPRHVHDVVNAQRRHLWLARAPAIGFGVAFVLAIAALVLSPKRRELLLPALFALALIVLLTLFVVSARQRHVLLVPLAILGGVGAAEIVALLRRPPRARPPRLRSRDRRRCAALLRHAFSTSRNGGSSGAGR